MPSLTHEFLQGLYPAGDRGDHELSMPQLHHCCSKQFSTPQGYELWAKHDLPSKKHVTAMFLLEFEENQSTERWQTWLWESCDILSRGYPCTFRDTENCIFLESSECITGYQIKDLLGVPLGLFFSLCAPYSKTGSSLTENWEPMWGVKECPKFMIHSLSSISQKSYGFSWHSSHILQGTEV